MVDIEILKLRGVTSDRLKQMFTAKKGTDFDKAEVIRKRLNQRCDAGRSWNFSTYRYWYSCDLAWDVPFRQTTYTLVRGLIDRSLSGKEILSVLEGMDVSEMISVYDKSGKQVTTAFDPKEVKEVKVHAPTFFQIFIPLAKAYTTIRAAAIINSYRQVPLFKYEAAKSTKLNRTKSDVITDRVELMSTQYGYYDVLKRAVLQMLHYSQAILFPSEEWNFEKQLVREKDGATPKEVVVKEGVRFNIPHPSRVFLDPAYAPSTINSDSGVGYGGYWYITRFSEVAGNKLYWNTDRITDGKDLVQAHPGFFNTVYNSCALRFNVPQDNDKNDREGKIGVYTADYPDRAVTITNYFERLNPKDVGIGDYDYPVWFRFVVASDDTVIYAAPLPYSPMVYFGYDALETRAQNASMTLEVLPFQDHITNLFSQYLLTVKQNLANVTFFDTNQVDKKVIDDIQNLGQKTYVAQNFAPIDMRANRMVGQNNIGEAFQSFNFPYKQTDGLLSGVNQILGVLERVLVISPQELAQTASHELTAEEVRNMNQAKSTRYEFTAGAVDRGVYALKVLLYRGLMAYAEPDLFARLPMPVDEKALKELGFVVEDAQDNTALVSGKKSSIMVESFASTRDGDLRVDNVQAATSMVQMLQTIMGNPVLFEAVGIKQIVDLINQITQVAGLPRDFRFAITEEGTKAQQMQAVQQQVMQLAEQIQQSTVGMVGQQLEPVFAQQAQRFQELEAQLQEVIQAVQQIPPPAPPPMAMPPEALPPLPAPPPGALPPPTPYDDIYSDYGAPAVPPGVIPGPAVAPEAGMPPI